MGVIAFGDLLDVEISVAELGIAKPKAKFKPRGDLFLNVEHNVSICSHTNVNLAYSIEITVVNHKAVKITDELCGTLSRVQHAHPSV